MSQDGMLPQSPVMELLQDKHMQVLVVAALFLQMGQQLCGINAVFYYSSSFFEGIIASPLLGSTLVALINVAATYVALVVMDTTARRTLLLWSAGGMLISTALITCALLGLVRNVIALLAVMAYVSFFEIGLGPIPWLIVAEMFDAKYVATASKLPFQLIFFNVCISSVSGEYCELGLQLFGGPPVSVSCSGIGCAFL